MNIDYCYRLDYKYKTVYFPSYEELAEFARTLNCDYKIFRPSLEK